MNLNEEIHFSSHAVTAVCRRRVPRILLEREIFTVFFLFFELLSIGQHGMREPSTGQAPILFWYGRRDSVMSGFHLGAFTHIQKLSSLQCFHVHHIHSRKFNFPQKKLFTFSPTFRVIVYNVCWLEFTGYRKKLKSWRRLNMSLIHDKFFAYHPVGIHTQHMKSRRCVTEL